MDSKRHAQADEETADRAALYLLGGMKVEEVSDFEQHLHVCPPCRKEVSSLRPLVDDLVLAGPEVEPPDGLRERVLAKARGKSFTLLAEAGRAWRSGRGSCAANRVCCLARHRNPHRARR